MNKSFNTKSGFDKNTKILIVGTLTTPEGMAHGYFYSSSYNHLYAKLSKIFDEDLNSMDSFVGLKKRLICETNQTEKDHAIKAINRKLQEKCIAFFDVVEEFERKKKYSPDDADIKVKKYAKDFYYNKKGNIALYIFTSNNAKQWFCDNIDNIDDSKSILLHLFRKKDNTDEVKKRIELATVH